MSISKNQLGKKLCKAASDGNVDIIKSCISQGADVNYKDKQNGFTPLHFAALANQEAVVRILLANNADVTIPSRNKSTILHRLCYNGHEKLDLARLFLELESIDINARNNIDQSTALHYACRLGQEEYAKLLIEYGASITMLDGESYLPVDIADLNRHFRLARWLRQVNANIDWRQKNMESNT